MAVLTPWRGYVDAVDRLPAVLDTGDCDAEMRSAFDGADGYFEALFYRSTGPDERLAMFLDLPP